MIYMVEKWGCTYAWIYKGIFFFSICYRTASLILTKLRRDTYIVSHGCKRFKQDPLKGGSRVGKKVVKGPIFSQTSFSDLKVSATNQMPKKSNHWMIWKHVWSSVVVLVPDRCRIVDMIWFLFWTLSLCLVHAICIDFHVSKCKICIRFV